MLIFNQNFLYKHSNNLNKQNPFLFLYNVNQLKNDQLVNFVLKFSFFYINKITLTLIFSSKFNSWLLLSFLNKIRKIKLSNTYVWRNLEKNLFFELIGWNSIVTLSLVNTFTNRHKVTNKPFFVFLYIIQRQIIPLISHFKWTKGWAHNIFDLHFNIKYLLTLD